MRDVREERHKAGALDSLVELPLMACRYIGASLAHDACVWGQESLQVGDVLVVNVEWHWF